MDRIRVLYYIYNIFLYGQLNMIFEKKETVNGLNNIILYRDLLRTSRTRE